MNDTFIDLQPGDEAYLQFYDCDYPDSQSGMPPELSSQEMVPYQAGDWIKRQDIINAMGAILEHEPIGFDNDENGRHVWPNRWRQLEKLLQGDTWEV